MTWNLSLNNKKGIYATLNGVQFNTDTTINLYDGDARLLEIWQDSGSKDEEPKRITKYILIGSGTAPEE